MFAGAILAIPAAVLANEREVAHWLIAVVCLECLVLVLNGMRCPLTDVAARYTDDRRDNFDIYLPLWLAHYNKTIFGALFTFGLIIAAAKWAL